MGFWDKKEPKKEAEPESINLDQLEEVCYKELGEVEKSFRQRMEDENKRFRDMCDTEYWFCACFTSREQKEEFLNSLGLDPEEKYIDGKDLAKAVKRPIKAPDIKFARIGKGSDEYLSRSMPKP